MSRIALRLIHPIGDGTYRDEMGRARPLLSAPIGSVWFADWWPMGERGPDGRFLVIMTTVGTWCPDRQERTRYTRSGRAPDVTISPDLVRESGDGPVRTSVVDGVMETT